MAVPLSTRLETTLAVPAISLLGEHATKGQLLASISEHCPALVYTASHGLGALGEPAEVQRKYNGAICCQRSSRVFLDDVLSCDDVPVDQPFLDGGVVFQFACYGYGTPIPSTFRDWLQGVPCPGDRSFVSALPKRLLAHPYGPIAYVGHLDLALLHGFTDGAEQTCAAQVHPRLKPIADAVDRLVHELPVGYALEPMNMRMAMYTAMLGGYHYRQRRIEAGQQRAMTAAEKRELVQHWLMCSDAQNYMMLGDPAISIRLPPA
jgi:hypothetical protein